MGLIEDIRQLAQGNPTMQGVMDQDNAYIDQLIGEAQGDLSRVLARIDAEHKLALGTDDGARAAFMERVADQLEQRIGRIPYDYERYTSRELEDRALGMDRITSDRTTALDRLDEDERVLKEEARLEAEDARQTNEEDLNERGVLQGGLANKQRGDLEGDITRRADEITRMSGRDRTDINLDATRSMEDLRLGSTRRMEDITTLARRGAIDANNTAQFGQADAQAQFDQRRTALERERKRLLAQAPSSASYIDSMKYGYG